MRYMELLKEIYDRHKCTFYGPEAKDKQLEIWWESNFSEVDIQTFVVSNHQSQNCILLWLVFQNRPIKGDFDRKVDHFQNFHDPTMMMTMTMMTTFWPPDSKGDSPNEFIRGISKWILYGDSPNEFYKGILQMNFTDITFTKKKHQDSKCNLHLWDLFTNESFRESFH